MNRQKICVQIIISGNSAFTIFCAFQNDPHDLPEDANLMLRQKSRKKKPKTHSKTVYCSKYENKDPQYECPYSDEVFLEQDCVTIPKKNMFKIKQMKKMRDLLNVNIFVVLKDVMGNMTMKEAEMTMKETHSNC